MWTFLRYELRYWTRTPMVWIFMSLYALIAFGATASESFVIGGNPANIFKNAPYQIQNYYAVLSIFFLLLTTPFMNATANRDFETGMYQFVFSSPVKKRDYFFGKFFGAYIISVLPLFGVLIGTLLGPVFATTFGWTPAERYRDTSWLAHFYGFLSFGIPNVFISGTLIFGLAMLFRSTIVSFVGTFAMLVCYLISGEYLSDLQTEWVAAITDPFGARPFGLMTKYLTIGEKNYGVIGLEGDLLINRITWIAISAVILLFIYWRFSFSAVNRKTKVKKEKAVAAPAVSNKIFEPKTAGKFTWAAWWNIVKFETSAIVKNPVYIILMAIGFIVLIIGFCTLSDNFGTARYPTTYIVTEDIVDSYAFFFYAFITFYTGVLVWKERDAKINEIQDATPVLSGMLFTSKIVAVFISILIVMLATIALGIITQALYGYTEFEIGLYLKQLILLRMSHILFLIVLSLLFHYLINNRYIAWFAFICFLLVNGLVWSALEIGTNMVSFGSRPNSIYSDMNGYGPFVTGLAWFTIYWGLFCTILLFVIAMFFVRGKQTDARSRWTAARQEFGRKKTAIALAVVVFGICGGFVYYNTQVLNTYDSVKEDQDRHEAYEREFKRYEGLAQPRYCQLDYKIDLVPESRSMKAEIVAWARNSSAKPISELHFTMPDMADSIAVLIPNASAKRIDKRLWYRIYELGSPLQPGDSIRFEVKLSKTSPGFENEVTFTGLTQDGTFFNSDNLLPHFGYQPDYEIQDKNKRAKLKLPVRKRMPKLDDNNLAARANTYIANDADWVRVNTVISTSESQTAIAPGSLVNEWKQNGRRYFRYKLDHKALNFYSFLSAEYEVARQKWNGIDLEVYYDKKHAYNVPNMLKSMQKSLDYYTKNFGPYYQKQCRIIEFPRYAGFAQAFPGTMPYSEAIGFITDLRNVTEADIDMVFYIVAHEMAHQWWAHQLCGANMQGSEMLSESFAQYSALMVMEKEYGKDKMKKFLKYEMDDYLSGRSYETESENPIMRTESQSYIHYNKASVVMYYLKEMIGERKTNEALRNLLDQFAHKGPPYATSNFAVREFKRATPDSLQYLISDMFENITLFNNRMVKARFEKKGKDFWVTLETKSEKFRSDSVGNEKPMPIADYIDVTVFAKPEGDAQFGKVLSRKRVKITKANNAFSFKVREQPHNAGIDPYNYLVDRIPDDNIKAFD